MYRALVRFAQRWQAKLQHGRFVAGAGERGARRRMRMGGALGGRRRGRRARARGGPQGAMRAQKRMPNSLAGRSTTWCVSPAPRAACMMRLTSDSGPPISMSAGTSRSPMWRVDDVGLRGQQQLSARRLTAQIESWPSTSRNGSCGRRRGVGRRRDEQARARSACRRATPAGCRPAPAGGRSGRRSGRLGGSGLRGPEGRRDVGVRSRGFHLTAVIRLCDVVFSRSGHPPRPAIEDV